MWKMKAENNEIDRQEFENHLRSMKENQISMSRSITPEPPSS